MKVAKKKLSKVKSMRHKLGETIYNVRNWQKSSTQNIKKDCKSIKKKQKGKRAKAIPKESMRVLCSQHKNM